METYIVRVYRRKKRSAGILVGVIEELQAKEKYAFENGTDFRAILCQFLEKAEGKNTDRSNELAMKKRQGV